MNIINLIKDFFTLLVQNQNIKYSSCPKTNLKLNAIDYINKQVSVIGLNNSEYQLNQFCKHIEDNDIALISDTVYDNNSKIYHTYYDCYEDWPLSNDFKFSKWHLIPLDKLKGYSECKRCIEREYRNTHPNLGITGYSFNYYYENLK